MPEPVHVPLATDSGTPPGLGRHLSTLARELAADRRVTLSLPDAVPGAGDEARAAGPDARARAGQGGSVSDVRPDVRRIVFGR